MPDPAPPVTAHPVTVPAGMAQSSTARPDAAPPGDVLPGTTPPGTGLPLSPGLRLHLLLFPAMCRGCGRMLDPLARAHPGLPYLCRGCHTFLPWRIEAGATPGVRVSAHAAIVEKVWAPWQYEEPVRGWIHRLKYDGRDALAIALGRLAADGPAGAAPLDGVDWIAPVPLHRRRLRERGFNQAALLAHHWRRGLARRGHRVPPLVTDLLARRRYTTPQVHLDADERLANVTGAFGPGRARVWHSGDRPLTGKRILLVDDVMTTGATLATCAALLLDAGAAAVDALVLARTH